MMRPCLKIISPLGWKEVGGTCFATLRCPPTLVTGEGKTRQPARPQVLNKAMNGASGLKQVSGSHDGPASTPAVAGAGP